MRVVGEVMRIVTQTFLHLNIGWNGVSEEVDFHQNFPELSITAQKHHDVFSSNSDESGVFHVMGEKTLYGICREVCLPGCTTPLRNHWKETLPAGAFLTPNWKVMYKFPTVGRTEDLNWRLVHQALATQVLLQKFNPSVSNSCPFCMSIENLNHAFIECQRLSPLFL